MKKALIVILIVILILAVLTVAGLLAYKHFVTERSMSPEDPGPIQMTDGDYTYVDNDILMPVLAGTWESTDGRYRMILSEDYDILLTMDGETVLEDTYSFTYLQPGIVNRTDLFPGTWELTQPDGTVFQIRDLYHKVSDSDENGRIILALLGGSTGTEEIEFTKQ